MPQASRSRNRGLLSPCHQLACSQISRTDAQRNHSTSILVLHRHSPVAPVLWKRRSLRRNAMRVVSEGLMKWRTLADRAIDQVRIRGRIQRVNIRFVGSREFCGRFGKAPKNCLAANNHKPVAIGNAPGRADKVFEFSPFHCVRDRFPSARAASGFRRTGRSAGGVSLLPIHQVTRAAPLPTDVESVQTTPCLLVWDAAETTFEKPRERAQNPSVQGHRRFLRRWP